MLSGEYWGRVENKKVGDGEICFRLIFVGKTVLKSKGRENVWKLGEVT